jgi:hypothetical protein
MYNRIERKSWLDRDKKDILREEIRESSEKETIILEKLDTKLKNLYKTFKLNEISLRISRFQNLSDSEKSVFKNFLKNLADSKDNIDHIENKINKILEQISYSLNTDVFFKHLELIYQSM